MPRRRSGRFVLEALFLAGVAAAVTVANLRPVSVIVLMALAWAIVALLEWTAWLDEPHYGRGLPPRYYVPQVALPPSRPVEQAGNYPIILEPDEESTFVTAVTEWSAALEEWPVLAVSLADEETQIAVPDEELEYGFESDPEREPRFPPIADPDESLEAEPGVEEATVEPSPEEEPPPASVEQPLPAGPGESGAARPRLPALERVAATTVHHVDPLGPSGRRRLFRRTLETAVVVVPDGPPPDRLLPGRAARPGPPSRP